MADDFTIALSTGAIDELVERVAERVLERLELDAGQADEDRWMGTGDAAAYLGLSANALHKLTAARAVPFEQEVVGGKCWFLRSELDAWRRGQRP